MTEEKQPDARGVLDRLSGVGSLLTLTALEIVLGIDNLIFLSIVSGRLPKHQQRAARRSAWPWRCSGASRCCSR